MEQTSAEGLRRAPATDPAPEAATTVLPTTEADDSPTTRLPATEGVTASTEPAATPSDGPAEPLGDPESGGTTTTGPSKPDLLSTRLQRSKDDRMIGGVCGGLAKSLKIDALWLRLGLIVAVLLGFGIGLVVYLACWVLMPEED